MGENNIKAKMYFDRSKHKTKCSLEGIYCMLMNLFIWVAQVIRSRRECGELNSYSVDKMRINHSYKIINIERFRNKAICAAFFFYKSSQIMTSGYHNYRN